LMLKSLQKSALLIAGPTASGKSALAMRYARERGGVIINADSMQVYSELRIVTARPSIAEEDEVPHRLYGHVSGFDDYSVGRWLADAKREMTTAWEQGALPIVVGGTGLYFMALMGGLADVPPIDADVREKWRGFDGDLHAELRGRDEEGAAILAPTDRQRLIRALEVFESTGKPLWQWQRDARDHAFLNQINVERLLVDGPREELYARADRRFEAMIEGGALDEVRALPAMTPDKPLMKAIGVPELLAHLQGATLLDEAVALAKIATRQYIKRQLTWARGQMKDWTLVGPS
jgi:tRNA dimethylallyltransferase